MDLRTQDPVLRRLIDLAARRYGIPAVEIGGDVFTGGTMLEGQVLTESSGNPLATRFEPAHQDSSYGLMQIMGANIRSIMGLGGGPIDFTRFAFDPQVNLFLGCTILAEQIRAIQHRFAAAKAPAGPPQPPPDNWAVLSRALARYNGGGTGDAPIGPGGAMRCQGYVDRVVANARVVRDNRYRTVWVADKW